MWTLEEGKTGSRFYFSWPLRSKVFIRSVPAGDVLQISIKAAGALTPPGAAGLIRCSHHGSWRSMRPRWSRRSTDLQG